MNTYLAFPSCFGDDAYGEDLPIAVLIRVDAGLLQRIEGAADAIERGENSTTVLNLPATELRWIKMVGYRADNSLAAIPGFFDPDVDSVICVEDMLNMDIDGTSADFADHCDVFEGDVKLPGLGITKHEGLTFVAPTGSIDTGRGTFEYGAPYEKWHTLHPQLRAKVGLLPPESPHGDALTLKAMQMAELLGRAGIVHPIDDEQGRRQILEWARSMNERADAQQLIRQTSMHARSAYWVAREDRQVGEAPVDAAGNLFRLELAAVQDMCRVAPYVPVSAGQRALMDKVLHELTQRAWTQLQTSRTVESPLTVEADGRFIKLKSHGLPVATLQGEQSIDLWLSVLHGNMGGEIRGDDEHEVCVEVNGKEYITSGEVRVTVRNEFMVREDGDGVEQAHRVQHVFTQEGLVTNVFDGEGNEVGTTSEMYGEFVDRFLVDQNPLHEAQR